MVVPSLELRAATAVYSPSRPPADRRLVDVCRIDQTYTMPAYDTLEAWERRKEVLREQILRTAGLLPQPPRTALEPVLGSRKVFGDYAVQTVALQSCPGFYLTGNLYWPLQVSGPLPGLLNPHGHSRRGRLEHTETSSTPARCISFARQGYVAFAYDMVGYNDARQIPHHFGNARDWLWGLGALGLQLWNSVRALDFLLSLPDVDPARVGCVGESGGATQTFLLAAIDQRVGFVAPVVMVSAHYQGGCVCENAPGLRVETSNMEIAAMAAPRPMTLVSATGDWTCNTPSVEYPAIRRIYDLYGAADRLSETQITAPHNFNQASREAVYQFFAHWFAGAPADQKHPESPLTPPPDEALRVFPDSLPDDALDSDGLRQATKRAADAQLRAALPHDAETLQRFEAEYGAAYRASLDPRSSRLDPVKIERLGKIDLGAYQATRLLLGNTTTGARVPALYFAGSDPARRPIVLAHAAGKAAYFQQQADSIEPGELLAAILGDGRAALLFDAFLTGDYQTPAALSGRDQSSPHFLTFNQSDAALRVQDVVTAVAAARELSASDTVDVLGLEEAGIWCILARPLAVGVGLLVADGVDFDPGADDDYLQRLYIPGLQRLGGLRTALLLAAPQTVRLFACATLQTTVVVGDLCRALGSNDGIKAQTSRADADQILGWLGI
ncbi:MAG TPA: hypothetical protein VIU62_12540 [Chloroflexota bacterium]|jgi:dienelactone hydrolase